MRTVVLIFDSLRADAALQCEELHALRDWHTKSVSVSQAPYTPSSLTTLATGLHPVDHGYWEFPPRAAQSLPHIDDYIFKGAHVPIAWASTHWPSTYMWPSVFGLRTSEQVVQWVKANPDGVLFVHIWETHAPYSRPRKIHECIQDMQGLSSVEDRVEYVNFGLRKALEVIRPITDALSDQDFVIATSDHGESLGEKHPLTGKPEWLHQHVTPQEIVCPFWVDGPSSLVVPDSMTHGALKGWLTQDVLGWASNERIRAYPWAVCRWRYEGQKNWTEQGLVYLEKGEWKVASEYRVDESDQILTHGDSAMLDSLRILSQMYGDIFDGSKVLGRGSGDADPTMYTTLRKLGYLS